MNAPAHRLHSEIEKWHELRDVLEAHELDEETLFDTLDGETTMVETIQIVASHITDIGELVIGITARQSELAERKARLKRAVESLRTVVLLAMDAADKKKLVTAEYTLSVSQRTPAPEITDEAAIPAMFWTKPDPVIDRAALTAAIKIAMAENETIAGVTIGDPVLSLTIRRK